MSNQENATSVNMGHVY